MSTLPSPALEQVQQSFSDWRSTGRSHRTPLELQNQAAQLLDHYPIGRICRALRLDHQRLKRWRAQLLSSSERVVPEFVELPPVASSAPLVLSEGLSLTLTHHAPDGSAVSISAQLEVSHWRWALRLLRESGA